MNIPRAIYGLIGVAVLVLGAVVWLSIHDRRVRETAELSLVVEAKDDTIRTLNADIKQLGIAILKADDAYAAAKGTVVRVAYVSPTLRDSLAVLNRVLDSLSSLGGTIVPISVARGFQSQLNACTRARDLAAAGAMVEESKCDKAIHLRDSQIADLTRLKQVAEDRLASTEKLAGLSRPRLTPFAGANYSLVRTKWDAEAGANMRLFGGLHVRGVVRYGDLGDSLSVRQDSLFHVKRHWDATLGGMYEFR
jgi:ACT domain-containing protein